jgi:hypothetical protein
VAESGEERYRYLLGSLFLASDSWHWDLQKFLVSGVGRGGLCDGDDFVSGADKAFLYEFLAAESREDEASRIFSRYEAAGSAGLFLAFPLGSLFAGSGILPYEQVWGSCSCLRLRPWPSLERPCLG